MSLTAAVLKTWATVLGIWLLPFAGCSIQKQMISYSWCRHRYWATCIQIMGNCSLILVSLLQYARYVKKLQNLVFPSVLCSMHVVILFLETNTLDRVLSFWGYGPHVADKHSVHDNGPRSVLFLLWFKMIIISFDKLMALHHFIDVFPLQLRMCTVSWKHSDRREGCVISLLR